MESSKFLLMWHPCKYCCNCLQLRWKCFDYNLLSSCFTVQLRHLQNNLYSNIGFFILQQQYIFMAINLMLLIAFSFELMYVVRIFAHQTSSNAEITLNLGAIRTRIHRNKKGDFSATTITALYVGPSRGAKKQNDSEETVCYTAKAFSSPLLHYLSKLLLLSLCWVYGVM